MCAFFCEFLLMVLLNTCNIAIDFSSGKFKRVIMKKNSSPIVKYFQFTFASVASQSSRPYWKLILHRNLMRCSFKSLTLKPWFWTPEQFTNSQLMQLYKPTTWMSADIVSLQIWLIHLSDLACTQERAVGQYILEQCPEVGIYKRKQESKKIRKQAFYKGSD